MTKATSVRLTGRPAAPGAAFAPAFVLSAEPPADLPVAPSGTEDEEVSRLKVALQRAEWELRELAQTVQATAGADEAAIFEAHAEFAADPELDRMAAEAIRSGASAERAVVEAFGTFRQLLAASDSEYLAARVDDLDDVTDRVVRILLGRASGGDAPRARSVIVAHELTPSQTASFPLDVIAGIVTETGSPTSHAAILARALGIPAVVSCPGLISALRDGEHQLGVDGRVGIVLVDPDPSERDAILRQMSEEDRRRDQLLALRDLRGQTADGHRVELAANIAAIQHLPAAIEAGAEGSGLVRTEFLFLGRADAPSVEEQVAFYAEVLRAFPGQRVVFRTMDVGADKPLPFVERDPEENPALGLRGIRLSLRRPQLFRDQLRALLRAGTSGSGDGGGRLAIMFPLVSTVAELLEARTILNEIADEEGFDLSEIEIGVMIEVPSAALNADAFAEHAQFFSIGTNDLLQYLFAADRLNGAVADLGDVLDPLVLSVIRDVAEAAHRHGAWVGVCGEAAGDPTVAAALVGIGVDELSMTRVAIPEVKDTLRRVTVDQCAQAVREALAQAQDAVGVQKHLEERLGTFD